MSDDWGNIERRRFARGDNHNEQVQTYLANRLRGAEDKIESLRVEVNTKFKQVNVDLACLHKQVEMYVPLLDAIKTWRDYRNKLKLSIVEKSLVGIVWACLGILAYSLIIAAREYLLKGPQ